MTSVATKGIRRDGLGDYLVLTSPPTSNSVTWELAKHENFQVSPQTCWIRKAEGFVLTCPPGDSGCWPRLRAPGPGTWESLPEKTTSPELERQNWLAEEGSKGQQYHSRGMPFWEPEISPMWQEQRKSKCRREGRTQPSGRGHVNFRKDFAVYAQVSGAPLTGFKKGSTFSGQ